MIPLFLCLGFHLPDISALYMMYILWTSQVNFEPSMLTAAVAWGTLSDVDETPGSLVGDNQPQH